MAKPIGLGAEWRRLAREAESLGYRSFLVSDHLNGEWGPLSGMCAALAETCKINIGSLMLNSYLYNPAVLAREIHALEQLWGERTLEIGIGAGWLESDFRRAGISYPGPKERIGRLEDYVRTLKSALRGEPWKYNGRHIKIPEGEVLSPPSRRLCLALGGGGKSALRVAVKHASIVNVGAPMGVAPPANAPSNEGTFEAFEDRLLYVRGLASEHGRHPELQIFAHVAHLDRSPGRFLNTVATRITGLSAAEAQASPLCLVGSEDEVAERIAHYRDAHGVTYWVIPSRSMREFAPVVARFRSLSPDSTDSTP